jgi:hypothetical protein
VKPSIRAAVIVTAGAFGLLGGLASVASADITDPSSPQSPPASGMRLPAVPQQQPSQASNPVPSQQPAPAQPVIATDQTPAEAPPAMTPQAAPAPEHPYIRSYTAPRATKLDRSSSATAFGPFDQVVSAVNSGLRDVGVFLREVASACRVGATPGTGGPVLVLAVLGMVAALDRRWVFGARWAAHEEMPELLYAGDVIAPG